MHHHSDTTRDVTYVKMLQSTSCEQGILESYESSPDWCWVQIDRLAADGAAHFDAAKERLAQDVKR